MIIWPILVYGNPFWKNIFWKCIKGALPTSVHLWYSSELSTAGLYCKSIRPEILSHRHIIARRCYGKKANFLGFRIWSSHFIHHSFQPCSVKSDVKWLNKNLCSFQIFRVFTYINKLACWWHSDCVFSKSQWKQTYNFFLNWPPVLYTVDF